MNSELLCRTLNFHGKVAYDAIVREQGEECLKAVSLDKLTYDEYNKSLETLSLGEKQIRQKFSRFIGKKAAMLFKPYKKEFCFPEDEEAEKLFGLTAPFEVFLNILPAERRRLFFQHLKFKDILIGRIHIRNLDPAGYKVNIICFSGGKYRKIDDLSIRMFLPDEQIPEGITIEKGNYVKVMVIGYNSNIQFACVSLKNKDPNKDHVLGLLTTENMPLHYRMSENKIAHKYYDALKQSSGFNNPGCTKNLLSYFQLDPLYAESFTNKLHNKVYPPEEYASAIKQQQKAKLSHIHFLKGVDHFKDNKISEAFMSLNSAIVVYPQNVEALVARGALYGNINNLRKAAEDLETALQFDPSNEKGKKYLSQILFTAGKGAEEETGDFEKALKYYSRAFELDKSNKDANEGAIRIKAKMFAKSLYGPYPPAKKVSASEDNPENIEDVRTMEELMAAKNSLMKILDRSPSPRSDGSSSSKRKKHPQKEDDHKKKCEQFLDALNSTKKKKERSKRKPRESRSSSSSHRKRKHHSSDHVHKSSKQKKDSSKSKKNSYYQHIRSRSKSPRKFYPMPPRSPPRLQRRSSPKSPTTSPVSSKSSEPSSPVVISEEKTITLKRSRSRSKSKSPKIIKKNIPRKRLTASDILRRELMNIVRQSTPPPQ